MTGNTEYDARRMFRHACAFADCALFCEKTPNSIVDRTQWYTVPEIVNSAFACEVFIKSLLVCHGMSLDNIKKLSHGLSGLWNALREKNPEITDLVEITMANHFNATKDEFFSEMLGYISDAFEKWRYIYEGHGAKINLNFLSRFRDCLRNACCVKMYNMTWGEYIGRNVSE